MGSTKTASTGLPKLLWYAIVIVLILIVIRVLYPQATPSKFEIAGLGSVSYQVSKDDIGKRQTVLEQQLKDLTAEVQASSQYRPVPFNAAEVTGTWMGDTGQSYQIARSGNVVALQEILPKFGVITAVAVGTINGRYLNMSYRTWFGSFGKLFLTVGPDGQEMTGTARDASTYLVQSITLHR